MLETLMYLAFCAAALPLAWLGVDELLYYHAHPDMLESRDSAPLVFAAIWALKIMEAALALGALLALYFLIRGPRPVRYSSTALITAWIVAFALGLLFVPSTRFASMARLYWDAAPFVALALLPLACAGVRLKKARPVPSDARLGN